MAVDTIVGDLDARRLHKTTYFLTVPLIPPVPKTKLGALVRPFPAPTCWEASDLPACRRLIPPGDHLTIATSVYREMDLPFWLGQAEEDRNT